MVGIDGATHCRDDQIANAVIFQENVKLLLLAGDSNQACAVPIDSASSELRNFVQRVFNFREQLFPGAVHLVEQYCQEDNLIEFHNR